jgi:hypothetical protein
VWRASRLLSVGMVAFIVLFGRGVVAAWVCRYGVPELRGMVRERGVTLGVVVGLLAIFCVILYLDAWPSSGRASHC